MITGCCDIRMPFKEVAVHAALTAVGVLLSMLQVLQDKTHYYIVMEQCTGEHSGK